MRYSYKRIFSFFNKESWICQPVTVFNCCHPTKCKEMSSMKHGKTKKPCVWGLSMFQDNSMLRCIVSRIKEEMKARYVQAKRAYLGTKVYWMLGSRKKCLQREKWRTILMRTSNRTWCVLSGLHWRNMTLCNDICRILRGEQFHILHLVVSIQLKNEQRSIYFQCSETSL